MSKSKKQDQRNDAQFEANAETQRWTSNDSAYSTKKVEIPAEDGNGALVSEQRHAPKG